MKRIYSPGCLEGLILWIFGGIRTKREMNCLFYALLSICVTDLAVREETSPINNNPGYGWETVFQSYVFLSGITFDETGYIVCDYKGHRIIHIDHRGEVETIVDRVVTPVDVEIVGDTYWILLNRPRQLISWNPARKERVVLYEDFDADAVLTAFAVESPNVVYVADFTGFVYKIDLIKRSKTVVLDGLDYPADIAWLPQGILVVTEEAGVDGKEGRLRFHFPDGKEIVHPLLDPAGLAVGPDGSVYVSVFFMENNIDTPIRDPKEDYSYKTSMGGIYRFRNAYSEPEWYVQGLRGPTSLSVLPNNDIVVIEESANSITKVTSAGAIEPFFQGTLYPLAIRQFSKAIFAFLTYEKTEYKIILVNGTVNQLLWSSSVAKTVPQMELGGDGLLYVYDPFYKEILVFDSAGVFLNYFFPENFLNPQLYSDPGGGIVLIQWRREGIRVQKANRREIGEAVEYAGDFSSMLYLDAAGNIRDAGKENNIDDKTLGSVQTAINTNGEIWFADTLKGEIYVVKEGGVEKIVEGLGAIQDISSDGDQGLNVTTEDGRIYHFFPNTNPGTPVAGWILY